MNINDLQAAVKRYHKGVDGYHNYLGTTASDRFKAEACFIADALTDPAPITREALEKLGFVLRDVYRFTISDTESVGAPFSFSRDRFEFAHYMPTSIKVINPQPQTMGHVMQLLLRLSRE